MSPDFRQFLNDYGADYQPHDALDFSELRRREYGRLDAQGQVYLDYVGSSLHAEAQVRKHAELLNQLVLGNPHSNNPSSRAAASLEEACRARVLEHFGADPNEYEVVFTLNASHALKLVGESFPFRSGGRFLYTSDSHSSVVGIRRFAQRARARVACCPVTVPDLRLDRERVAMELGKGGSGSPRLFALTGQSNTTGVRHPLELADLAHVLGWSVLLDAAALAPTWRLDLGQHPCDFVSVSFYKMFGYPTGVGALIARRSALARLERPWFAGGTVRLVSAFFERVQFMTDRTDGSHFQDGTLPYSALPAVTIGLDHLAEVRLDHIRRRIRTLTSWLLGQLADLHHDNGAPLVRLYGPATVEARGGTLAMNLLDRDGRWIPHQLVERTAADAGISIRTGCFCNPGVAEQALGYSKHSEHPPNKLGGAFLWMAPRVGVDRMLSRIAPFERPFGMVRCSLGVASNFEDASRWIAFLKGFLDAEYVGALTRAYAERFQPPTTLC